MLLMLLLLRRGLRSLRRPRGRGRFQLPSLRHVMQIQARAREVRRMVQQATDIVHKERIKQVRDLLLVRKIERSFKGNPCEGQLSRKRSLHTQRHTYHTPFRCIGPIFTTWRIFSLFKIPSRRPRVIPATFRSLVPLIMWLSTLGQHEPTQFPAKESEVLNIPSLRATQTPFASTW